MGRCCGASLMASAQGKQPCSKPRSPIIYCRAMLDGKSLLFVFPLQRWLPLHVLRQIQIPRQINNQRKELLLADRHSQG